GGLRLVTADLEVDEHGVPVLRERAAMDVLHRRQLRNARDDVIDRSGEGGVADARRAALDEDALPGGLLEPGVEDRVHPARLARAVVLVDVFRAHEAAEAERDDDEDEPANGRLLPMRGAPTTHAGRETWVLRFAVH